MLHQQISIQLACLMYSMYHFLLLFVRMIDTFLLCKKIITFTDRMSSWYKPYQDKNIFIIYWVFWWHNHWTTTSLSRSIYYASL